MAELVHFADQLVVPVTEDLLDRRLILLHEVANAEGADHAWSDPIGPVTTLSDAPQQLVATGGPGQVTIDHLPAAGAVGYRYDVATTTPLPHIDDPLTDTSGPDSATFEIVDPGVTQDASGLHLPVTAKGAHLGSTVRTRRLPLAGHMATVRLAAPAPAGNGSRTWELAWTADDTGGNRIGFVWNDDAWSVRLAEGGTHGWLVSPWGTRDASVDWARIRHDGTYAIVETSPDGVVWTEAASVVLAPSWDLTAGRFVLDAEFWGSEDPAEVVFADFAYQPDPTVPAGTPIGLSGDYTTPPHVIPGLATGVDLFVRVAADLDPGWSDWTGWASFSTSGDDGPDDPPPPVGDAVDGNTGGLEWYWDANNFTDSLGGEVTQQESTSSAITLVTSPKLAGNNTVRIECVGPRDNGVAGSGSYGKRTEVRFRDHALAPTIGTTRVYGFLVYVDQLLLPPAGSHSFLTLVQFHGGAGSPVFALEFDPDGSLHMWRRGGDPQVNSGWEKRKILNPGQFQLKRTYPVMVETRWESSASAGGYHKLWLDGVSSSAWESHGKTRYASSLPYWKAGFYGTQRDGTCVAYYDNFCRSSGPNARANVLRKLGLG